MDSVILENFSNRSDAAVLKRRSARSDLPGGICTPVRQPSRNDGQCRAPPALLRPRGRRQAGPSAAASEHASISPRGPARSSRGDQSSASQAVTPGPFRPSIAQLPPSRAPGPASPPVPRSPSRPSVPRRSPRPPSGSAARRRSGSTERARTVRTRPHNSCLEPSQGDVTGSARPRLRAGGAPGRGGSPSARGEAPPHPLRGAGPGPAPGLRLSWRPPCPPSATSFNSAPAPPTSSALLPAECGSGFVPRVGSVASGGAGGRRGGPPRSARPTRPTAVFQDGAGDAAALSRSAMASGCAPPFGDAAEMREGFLCPLCLKDLQAFQQLRAHYEEEHSGEDRDVRGQIRSKGRGGFSMFSRLLC